MIAQIMIAFTGLAAILISQQGNKDLHKYACLFGLFGQPFWFYAAYVSEQWGIFILCVFYTLSWLKGVHTYWLKP